SSAFGRGRVVDATDVTLSPADVNLLESVPFFVFDTGPAQQFVTLHQVAGGGVQVGDDAFTNLSCHVDFEELTARKLFRVRESAQAAAGTKVANSERRRIALRDGGHALLTKRDEIASDPGRSQRTADPDSHTKWAEYCHDSLLLKLDPQPRPRPASLDPDSPATALPPIARAEASYRRACTGAGQRAEAAFVNRMIEWSVQAMSVGSYCPIILMGKGSGKGSGGWARQKTWTPARMAEILSRSFTVIMVDEYNTSKYCVCGASIEAKGNSWRVKRCSSCTLGRDLRGTVSGWSHRDWLSCNAIFYVALSIMVFGDRPGPFARSEKVVSASQRPADEGGGTGGEKGGGE
ncbi:MAG: hypothetical protein SXU28_15500, partial [Pseudomonadota bacterium]|nr:hypothetical protein [Pseudomonadota bacterium]